MLRSFKATKFLVLVLLVSCLGCSKKGSNSAAKKKSVPPASHAEVVRFCADCHAFPHPDTFPMSMWRAEVEQGYQFYKKSGRTDLVPPDLEAVVSYYENLSSEEFPIPLAQKVVPSGPIVFVEASFDRLDAPLPGISHMHADYGTDKASGKLMVTDMLQGHISQFYIQNGKPKVETVGGLSNPAHAHPGDLDGNGVRDWIISDLGSSDAADHSNGLLGWMEMPLDGGDIKSTVIYDGVGRVADARSADFDGDGDLDIAVAVFGWRETGKLVWLEQLPPKDGELQFKEHLLSDRHGASHVPIIDIDNDGDLDIVVLFSQAYESVEVYLNDGSGDFENKVLFEADDPSYGSSSIDVVDLDNDDDWDIIYTNGDSLDSNLLKPYHSVQWLEQTDDLKFVHHEVTRMPGAYCVKAGDLDGDGDIDLVASSMALSFEHPFYSLIWLEQVEGKRFVRHNLESGTSQHACLELGDFDGDNDLDIAVGHFEPREIDHSPWISIWWNEGKREAKSP